MWRCRLFTLSPWTIFQFFNFFDKLVLLFCEFFFLFFSSLVIKCKMCICYSPFQVFTSLFYFYCCFMQLLFGTILPNNYCFQLYSFMILYAFLVFIGFFSWHDFGVMLCCIHLCKNIRWFFAITFFIFCCCNDKISLSNSLSLKTVVITCMISKSFRNHQ